MRGRRDTSSSCSITRLAGALQRRTATIQNHVSMRTTLATSAAHQTSSSMHRRIARLYRTERDGTTATAASSVASATPQLSAFIIQTNTSALSAIVHVVTKWTSAHSFTLRKRKAMHISCASSILRRANLTDYPTSTSCTKNCSRHTQRSKRSRICSKS